MIIRPNFLPGTRVDFVPRPGNEHGPGGEHGLGKLPEHHVLSAHEKAIQEGQGVRKRAVIDAVIDDNQVRLMLTDSLELVWASPDEIEPLDSISTLGDLVGPASRSFKDALETGQQEIEANAPAARFDVDDQVRGLLDREWKVTYRAYNPLEGHEQWEYHLEADDGLRQHHVAEGLLEPAPALP